MHLALMVPVDMFIILSFLLGYFVVLVVATWRIFVKAGRPGWAALIPIYNMIVFCRVAGKSAWWVLFMCIPYVGWIAQIFVLVGLSNQFRKSGWFAVGLVLLTFIFLPILGFGKSVYGGHDDIETLDHVFA